MKFQSFFYAKNFQVPTKYDFLYFSLHLSKWNESELSIFIKMYRIKNIFSPFEKLFEKIITHGYAIHILCEI